jgi:RNA polymerase sigma-70 factor (ECF subfamily)
MQNRVPKDVVGHVAEINGKRAVIGYLHGKPFSVVSVNVSKGRIKDVFVVTNPDKLAHLPWRKEDAGRDAPSSEPRE